MCTLFITGELMRNLCPHTREVDILILMLLLRARMRVPIIKSVAVVEVLRDETIRAVDWKSKTLVYR